MIDIAVSCSSKYPVIRANIGEEEFFPAIKVIEKDGSSSPITDANRKMLRELVLKRISEELIEEKALESAIKMSGGVVRELIRILQQAIFNAEGKVREDHVDYAVIRIRNNYNLYPPHTRVLKAVLANPNWVQTPTAQEGIEKLELAFLELLHMPALFQYRNREDKWYRPYPIFITLLDKLR